MNIGEVAKSSGMSAKMIRHYEETGLIRAAARTGSNYRVYSSRDVQVLRFVQQARHLGFSTRQIAVLLALWEDRSRSSREVKRLANAHIADLNSRIQELVDMRDTLMHLAKHCKGDSRPDCPILDKLVGGTH
ncbi:MULTISPECIES: Cu(I)-responsive transcriptional regulator [Caballeronia]|uniref:MerR family transcriptional regulator n=1 Tax=Caballeronia zhejiangensis TaxID=871203 RepID=A0A656QGN8_9BURK|nr:MULTISPECIES: Cu(I)-responsive transcriptional regulator [Caballeronia]KDR28402.1 MerR family transcriptional regulator [Caballeronia zhejiangensis]MCE4547754.1 Cu(I)-responsive transcriptional regulator [Caballeronia sp. PC1]MCE4575692.1 Cu(I)-responsive transcriptional regulator [Caballeronia sp. CLC5]